MSSKNDINGYTLSRNWFDFCFENPEKIKPNHTALYFFAIEHCNRLGWKKKFGFPTTMAMEAIGIKSYNTYISTLKDLVEWGFIEMVERSKNQYSSNIIALSNFDKALNKALDKALIKHGSKQHESNGSIYKQENKEPVNQKQKIVDVIPEIDSIDCKNTLLALHIWKDVNDLRPNNKTTLNAKLDTWSEPIRLMVQQDDRSHEEIWNLWKSVRKDDFWKTNILSTVKLREKFDQLAIKLQPTKKNHAQFVDQLYQ